MKYVHQQMHKLKCNICHTRDSLTYIDNWKMSTHADDFY